MRLGTILCCALAVVSLRCGGGTTLGTLTLNFSGYLVHSGKFFSLKVKRADTGETVGTFSGNMATSGILTAVVPNALEEGTRYRVEWFSDFDNDDQVYTSPTGGTFHDHSWRIEITGRSAGLTQNHAHDQNWVDLTPF